MRRLFYLVCILVMISCEDSEVLPKDYPFVMMHKIRVDQNGVEFVGEITDLGNLSIREYGFIGLREQL